MMLNNKILWIISAVLVFILLFLWKSYNSFIKARNKVKADFADIDVQLKRRASLIENLATIVKEYAKHEKDTFIQVTEARSAVNSAKGPKDSATAENMLTSTLKSLFAVSENYPELKASGNFKDLQNQLTETENLISSYRETYNQTVLDYNTMIQTFPNLLAAGIFGFKEEELFQAASEDKSSIKL